MSELSESKRDGSKLQKNSGRGQFAKGDATLPPFMIDYKEYSKSFGISQDVWAKTCTDAQRAGGLEPALKLVLGTDNKVRLFVISETMFHQMLEAYNEKYG